MHQSHFTSLTAIIGGSGLCQLKPLLVHEDMDIKTPYGDPSCSVLRGEIFGCPVVFLPRHGRNHSIAPHRINYRANIYALRTIGVTDILAFAAVGGINAQCTTQSLVLPHQLIDYTNGREHTFYDGAQMESEYVSHRLDHIEFSDPYDPELRKHLLQASQDSTIACKDGAVYGVTQGPRLETAAEIDKLERDGVDIVGMTAMPEAALARELGIKYAGIAMVVNQAAGRGPPIRMEDIHQNLEICTQKALGLLQSYFANFGQSISVVY